MNLQLLRRQAHGPNLFRWFAMVLLSCGALVPVAAEPLLPLPDVPPQNPARVDLGRKLFNDTRLSDDGRVSCASCHDLARGGMDGLQRSKGIHGRIAQVNTPTVFNAGFNFTQSWNGRAGSLEAQIDNVVRNPAEMDNTWKAVVGKLSQDKGLRMSFARAYKDGLTQANIQNAIASYSRTLVTPNARIDRYLRGKTDALTAQEKEGYAKFKRYGCASCHQGANVGGNMFQKFGIMGDYFGQRGNLTQADLGRYLVTRLEHDKHVFKVPSLRNVALTAPYFHDGSAATLEAAVDIMFRFQLGRFASREDRDDIVKFLHTLTGERAAQP